MLFNDCDPKADADNSEAPPKAKTRVGLRNFIMDSWCLLVKCKNKKLEGLRVQKREADLNNLIDDELTVSLSMDTLEI